MFLLAAFGSVIFQPICSLALCVAVTVRWMGWWNNLRLYLMLCALKQQPQSSCEWRGATSEWWIAVGEWCWTFLNVPVCLTVLCCCEVWFVDSGASLWCLFCDMSQGIIIGSLLNVSILNIVQSYRKSLQIYHLEVEEWYLFFLIIIIKPISLLLCNTRT